VVFANDGRFEVMETSLDLITDRKVAQLIRKYGHTIWVNGVFIDRNMPIVREQGLDGTDSYSVQFYARVGHRWTNKEIPREVDLSRDQRDPKTMFPFMNLTVYGTYVVTVDYSSGEQVVSSVEISDLAYNDTERWRWVTRSFDHIQRFRMKGVLSSMNLDYNDTLSSPAIITHIVAPALLNVNSNELLKEVIGSEVEVAPTPSPRMFIE
jgi:hypothetical protein